MTDIARLVTQLIGESAALDAAIKKLSTEVEADPAMQDFHLYAVKDRWLELNSLRVKPDFRGRGKGEEIVRRVHALADQFGLPVIVKPTAEPRRKGDLERFYRQLGYVPHQGRQRDFAIGGAFGGEWIRQPKTS